MSIQEQLEEVLSKRETMEQDVAQHASGDFQERMALFARLENYRRELEEALQWCKQESKKLAEPLMEDMSLHGIQNMNVEGLSVHQRRDFYCNKRGGVSTEDLCEVLRQHGLEYMVKEGYSASSLKAKIKELVEDGVELPSDLEELLNYGELTRLVTTKT